jgi:hypothetical protein
MASAKAVVGDPLAVRQAAPAVPADRCAEPVDVLPELPRQSRLAHTRVAVDDDEGRTPAVLGCVEELLDQPQLAIATDQRSLQAVGPLRSTTRSHDRAHGPERYGVGLALQLVTAHVDVGDRRRRQQAGGLVHPHLTRRRRRLHA